MRLSECVMGLDNTLDRFPAHSPARRRSANPATSPRIQLDSSTLGTSEGDPGATGPPAKGTLLLKTPCWTASKTSEKRRLVVKKSCAVNGSPGRTLQIPLPHFRLILLTGYLQPPPRLPKPPQVTSRFLGVCRWFSLRVLYVSSTCPLRVLYVSSCLRRKVPERELLNDY